MPYFIEKAPRGWAPIPDTTLEIFLSMKYEVPCLAFRKDKKELYVHVFCFEGSDQSKPLGIVSDLYAKCKLGIPEFPRRSNWIHTIPLDGPKLSSPEVLLIHQITQSIFWTVYMDFVRNKKDKLRS